MAQLQRLSIASFQFQARQIILTDEQLHYLFRVLRLRSGDRFIAMDGEGHWWLAELETQPSSARILEPIDACTELPVDVTLMVALSKGNGFDEVVRQATELGVACLAPVLSHRTLLKPSPQKLDRWRRIVSEAAEQSERQVVPTVLEPMDLISALSFVKSQSSFAQNQLYICEARGDFPHLIDCLHEAEKKHLRDRHGARRRMDVRRT